MGEAFRLGGWGMYPTLIFGLFLTLWAMRYAASPDPHTLPLVKSLGLLTVLSGLLGTVTGVIKAIIAVGQLPPEKHFLWVIGFGEALNCFGLGLVLAVLASLFVSAGNYRIAAHPAGPRRPSFDD
jgi:hypothetical protein